METKKFNSNEKARGGKNNTRTVLTASGISAAVGVATGATAAHLFGIKPKPDKDEENTQAQNNVNQEAQLRPQSPPRPSPGCTTATAADSAANNIK